MDEVIADYMSSDARLGQKTNATEERSAAMPNGDRSNLKMVAKLFDLHDVPEEEWHFETARLLRLFADHIETNGLKFPVGEIRNESTWLEYSVR
jgi:hypothetical protein